MGPLKKVNTGGLPFQEIRRRDKFYVDKSMLIADILDTDDSGIYLYTRPRRFGKSTNISMLDAFFNLEYAGNTWFDGLEISEHHEYDEYRNAFPVICIDMKDVIQPEGNTDYGFFLSRMRDALSQTYDGFRYLLDSDRIYDDEKERFRNTLDMSLDEALMAGSLAALCRMLKRHHGKKPIVLIDEYDRAVTDSFGTDMQSRILSFLGLFMSATLKSNNNLQMAYVTGVMQVAKAGMFSGANNFAVDNILSERSDERFGFTEQEVKGILEYYGHPEKMEEVRNWYDGYRFGKADVYNPFSVMSYISSGFKPMGYWANSGNDRPVRWMLSRTDKSSVDTVARLLANQSATVDIRMNMTYEDMRFSDARELFSLMVMTGYLKATPADDGKMEIAIPNTEVMGIVEDVMRSRVVIDEGMFREFCLAAIDADASRMESILRFLFGGASYHNLNHASYEVALLFVMRGVLRNYEVRTEREEGNGRTDIILTPADGTSVPIIIEIKVADRESSLDAEADGAIAQIHDRKYYNLMAGRVVLIGIAFRGVLPRVRCETLDLRP